MNRTVKIGCMLVLLVSSYIGLAQHRGGRTTTAEQPSPGATDSEELKDFKRAVALQASPDQIKQFKEMVESTEAARKAAQDLAQLAVNANGPDLFHKTDTLNTALDEAQSANLKFVQSLSEAQKSGLKDVIKKLEKSQSALTKENKDLMWSLQRPRLDDKHLLDVAGKLDKVLGDFQARQFALGPEMGIQSAESPK
jgi:hypothetical protein